MQFARQIDLAPGFGLGAASPAQEHLATGQDKVSPVVDGQDFAQFGPGIAQQQKNNESLKIKEAELQSLYNIEEESKQIDMVNVVNVKYLEESPSVAYGTASKNGKN